MRYAFARFLQVLGLATGALALYVGIAYSNSRAQLIYLGVAVAVFYAGVLLQGKRPE